MNKEWLSGSNGHNLKFKRATLLNYGMNRWGLNKAYGTVFMKKNIVSL